MRPKGKGRVKPKGKWAIRWYEDGLDEGRDEERSRLLRRLVALRFGKEAVCELAEHSAPLQKPEVADAVFEAAIACDDAEEFFARLRGCATAPASSPEA